MLQHKPRSGWQRYFDCMLYYREGAVSRAIYLDPRSGWSVDLQPYRLKGKNSICTRSNLNDGYFILANLKTGHWYDVVKGIRDIAYNEKGELVWL